jgi:hypothetical protein
MCTYCTYVQTVEDVPKCTQEEVQKRTQEAPIVPELAKDKQRFISLSLISSPGASFKCKFDFSPACILTV